MMPTPLHPALVHFPIVFMILLPLVALAALWSIRRGTATRRAWIFPVIAALVLTLSAWVASRAGEAEEEKVEDRISESIVSAHEEAAERFLFISAGVTLLLGVGMLRGRAGQVGRLTGTVATLGLLLVGYQVGHTGGRIVYGNGTTPGISAVTATANPDGTGPETFKQETDD